MLMTAVGLFGIAALGELTMAVMHFRGRTPPPSGLVAGHGALAAVAFLILLFAAFAL